MNPMTCVVRYWIVCEDILYPTGNRNKATLVNVTSFIRASDDLSFPVKPPELCVFAQLTECRGNATVRLDVVQADTEVLVDRIEPVAVTFGSDPLHVYGVPFRLRGCSFPARAYTGYSFGIMTI